MPGRSRQLAPELPMTSDDVRSVLESIATGLEDAQKMYPAHTADRLCWFVLGLTPFRQKVISLLAKFSDDEFSKGRADFLKVMDGLKSLFLTDQCRDIVAFCRGLEKRTLILRLAAWCLTEFDGQEPSERSLGREMRRARRAGFFRDVPDDVLGISGNAGPDGDEGDGDEAARAA
jgi:hypothetical protein